MQQADGIVYLVRHGETALNANGTSKPNDKIRGWMNVPLDATGIKQANQIAKKFEGKKVDAIFSSDLSRAIDTARIIGMAVKKQVSPTPSLRPWNLGQFQGKESKKVAPEVERYITKQPSVPVVGGESFNSFKHRLLAFMQGVISSAMAKSLSIICVTHYRDVRLIRAWLHNKATDDVVSLDELLRRDNIEHTDIWEVKEKNGELSIT